jgi:hypothetical protein
VSEPEPPPGRRRPDPVVKSGQDARQGEIILGRRGRWIWIGTFVLILILIIVFGV